MDTARIDHVLQYALAMAGKSDDWRARELGPIHLIKYAYLADLAYAEVKGETYTGLPWKFYHFGPYCHAVLDRVEPAMAEIDAIDRSFEGEFQDEVRRFKSRHPDDDAETAGRDLSVIVSSAIERAVKAWGADTQGLLHHVYNTRPMLKAAPDELLEFEQAEPRQRTEPGPTQTAREAKKSRERIERVRAKLAEKRAARKPRRTTPMRAPRYDEVYLEGLAWLDEVAGGLPDEHQGVLEIDDSVWKSETRGGGDNS